MDTIALFPPGNAPWGHVEQFTDVFKCVVMQDELEGMLLHVFADVAINYGKVEFAGFTRKKIIGQTFFFF